MRQRWQDRVVIDPDIHHGDPCIKGTRIPVATVVGSLADGMNFDEFLLAYPQLTWDDLNALSGAITVVTPRGVRVRKKFVLRTNGGLLQYRQVVT